MTAARRPGWCVVHAAPSVRERETVAVTATTVAIPPDLPAPVDARLGARDTAPTGMVR